jgi:hypothetical protein
VHIGGGTTTAFPSITVHRFGGFNVRAATRYVRDLLWRELDETIATGYSPEGLRVLWVGESAGGYGVMYNYHWVLDDMGWRHTTAVPDSSLALDNGSILGISGLGAILSAETGTLGWKLKPMLPTYCQGGTCGLGTVLMTATAPRLLAVPEQQWLNLSNQYDSTQVSTQFFSSTTDWITEMRTSYCEMQGLNGVHYFLPTSTSSIHTMLSSESRYTGLGVAGKTVREFLADAVASPASVVDRVEEGDIATTFGVPAFTCLP